MTRSSTSAGMGGPSSSLRLEEDEDSDGGTGELDGRSAGKIMLAGISASTTASLVNYKTCDGDLLSSPAKLISGSISFL